MNRLSRVIQPDEFRFDQFGGQGSENARLHVLPVAAQIPARAEDAVVRALRGELHPKGGRERGGEAFRLGIETNVPVGAPNSRS